MVPTCGAQSRLSLTEGYGRLWKFKGSEVDEWVHEGTAAEAQRDDE